MKSVNGRHVAAVHEYNNTDTKHDKQNSTLEYNPMDSRLSSINQDHDCWLILAGDLCVIFVFLVVFWVSIMSNPVVKTEIRIKLCMVPCSYHEWLRDKYQHCPHLHALPSNPRTNYVYIRTTKRLNDFQSTNGVKDHQINHYRSLVNRITNTEWQLQEQFLHKYNMKAKSAKQPSSYSLNDDSLQQVQGWPCQHVRRNAISLAHRINARNGISATY